MLMGRWGGVASYGLPGVLAGLILSWWAGGHGPTARAQGFNPGGETGGTIAFASQVSNTSSQMLYVIDTRTKALAVYRIDPTSPKGSGSLKLEAARGYQYDLMLREFNNQLPDVHSIETAVKAIPK